MRAQGTGAKVIAAGLSAGLLAGASAVRHLGWWLSWHARTGPGAATRPAHSVVDELTGRGSGPGV